VEQQDKMLLLLSVFYEIPILISIVALLIFTPTISIQGFSTPHTLASLPAFVVACFLVDITVTGVRWNHSVVLICISFMAKGVEHYFVHLLAIRTSSFENFLSNLLTYLLIGLSTWQSLCLLYLFGFSASKIDSRRTAEYSLAP
jgi:hypothetical protein